MATTPHKNWIKKDFHVHESHSSDAPLATVEKYYRMAERRGIDEICFTTHLILMGPDIKHGISPEKIPEYLEEIHTAQESTSVQLRIGLEIDWFPEIERRIDTIIEEYPLDYSLGSMHYVKGIDIGSRRHSPVFFLGRRLEDSLDIYFEEFAKAVESGLFDVMAHPDYFRKYLGLTHKMPVSWEEYGTRVYDVIDSLKGCDVGIGVNSSGWRHGIQDVYPILEFLKAAREAGVDKVVVGSDCHTIEGLGINTVKAVCRLQEAGYNHLCVFKDRRNRKISLSEVV
ncbi:MAG: histidinol-phosphatase HisJ family protein [Candidatus Bathyarchaeota archaeon]|jgi:histidinol-phosphatase (PHP family)